VSGWLLPVCFLLVLLAGAIARADDLNLDATWRISEQGMENEENISAYDQRYHAQWNPMLTRALTMDTSMDYNHNWTGGRGTREIITPTLNLDLKNDLFQAEFNGLATQTNYSDGIDQSISSWETALRSTWQYSLWPYLGFIFGQDRTSDSEMVHLTDSDREWYQFSAGWDYEALGTYYSYFSEKRSDHVEGTEYDEGRHFGRLDYSRFYLNGRGQFTLAQQVTDSTTDIDAEVGGGGSVNIAVSLTQGLAGVDPIPELGVLPVNPALIDGNRNTTAFVIRLQETANLGVRADLQLVDLLYVYTGDLDPLLLSETGDLRWDLYTSQNGNDWQRERVSPPTSYNRDQSRYEVDVRGVEGVYLKLVVTGWPATLAVPVTEIEAYRRQTGTDGKFEETQGYTRYVTDFNIYYLPTSATRASYSLTRDYNDSRLGNDRDRLFQSGNFQWMFNRYFTPSLTVNNTSTTNTETADELYRSYGLNIRSTPLPTLDATFGITRNEHYEDDEAVSNNNVYSLLASAILYPNLETTLDINFLTNNNEEVDQASNAFGIRWTLTGRLRQDLFAELITEYGINTVDFAEVGSTDESGGRTTVNVNYRLSERASFILNASQGYGDQWANYQTMYFSSTFSVIRTAKSQVILGYQLNANREETINNFSCNWSWNISEYLTFQTFANYLISDENIWGINARLTARF